MLENHRWFVFLLVPFFLFTFFNVEADELDQEHVPRYKSGFGIENAPTQEGKGMNGLQRTKRHNQVSGFNFGKGRISKRNSDQTNNQRPHTVYRGFNHSKNNNQHRNQMCDCPSKVACGIPNEPKCKHRRRISLRDGRITNGFEAVPHQFPWMVFIDVYMKNKSYTCGGSLLSPQWILTAAHCLKGAISITVFAGVHDSKKRWSSGVLWIQSKKYWLHEKYDGNTFEHDIAVIHLPLAFPLSDKIRPICLSEPSASYLGKYVTIAGWGDVSHVESENNVTTLQFAENRLIVENKVCQRDGFVPAGHFCLDTKSGTDPHNPSGGISTCFGDSGGPITFPEKDLSGNIIRYVQVGIVSFGPALCNEKKPEIDTRVADYRKWIYFNTGI